MKNWWRREIACFTALVKRVWPVFKTTAGITIPLTFLLYSLPAAASVLSAYYGTPNGAVTDAGVLIALLRNVLLSPVLYGGIMYALAARWEMRMCTLRNTFETVRARFGRIILTGLAAWLVSASVEMVLSIVNSLVGLITVLLGWIPGVGTVVSALSTAILYLVSMISTFSGQVVLAFGMLALLGDGLWAMPQMKQALRILWGGRTDTFPELTALFIVWVAAYLLSAAAGGLLLACSVSWQVIELTGAIASGVLLPLSATALSVIYLKERDRQDGVRF